MALCDDVFAELMLDTDEYLEEYKQQLRIELDRQNLLPDLNMEEVLVPTNPLFSLQMTSNSSL